MKTAALLTLLLAALSACADDGPRTATDAPATSPTASPSTFDETDYSYTLRTSCFCPDGGVPISVTVRDAEVADAVYARKGPGHAAGDPVATWLRLTIADIVDAADEARAAGAAEVDVRWPDGQDYPDSVWIDRDRNAADEEIGYEISNVTQLS